MKKVLLFSILLLTTLSVFAYETIIIKFPEKELWVRGYYKKVGTEARKDIEEFTEKKCFLELIVKVRKDWRNSDRDLRSFGYETKK